MSRLDTLFDALEGARCGGVPLTVRYPDPGGRRLAALHAEAASICDGCPALAECWEYVSTMESMPGRGPWGFAAGLRPEERAEVYRRRREAAA